MRRPPVSSFQEGPAAGRVETGRAIPPGGAPRGDPAPPFGAPRRGGYNQRFEQVPEQGWRAIAPRKRSGQTRLTVSARSRLIIGQGEEFRSMRPSMRARIMAGLTFGYEDRR